VFHVSLSHSIVVLGALAVGRALKFSLEIGISSAILEGDMEIVINAIKEPSPSIASFGLLIQDQGGQSRIGGYTGLISRTIYFGTSQYRCTVSSLPIFLIYIYIYMYVCIYVCVYIIINIKIYHKTLPQFRTNYSWF